jgi:hypothetical protein
MSEKSIASCPYSVISVVHSIRFYQSVSSDNAPRTPTVSQFDPDNTSVSRNVKRKDIPFSSPSPSLTVTKGLRPMLNGEDLKIENAHSKQTISTI